MKILYVAKHDCGDNQDEQAIAYALEQLGHEVIRVHEKRRHRQLSLSSPAQMDKLKADFCLFHKWDTVSEIAALDTPKCFWYFDMIRSVESDPTLEERSRSRIQWMYEVMPHCRACFYTDGDWVSDMQDISAPTSRTAKHYHLMQGADERYVGRGTPLDPGSIAPLLFAGMVNHGQRRAQHIAELRARYGDKLQILGDGGPKYRKHGHALASVFASTKIVIAPDGPNTDRYWSNRIYLTLGLGGFLLHPYCEGLEKQYSHNTELLMYRNRTELNALIDFYLDESREHYRQEFIRRGLEATKQRNLYRHRCQILVDKMKELI